MSLYSARPTIGSRRLSRVVALLSLGISLTLAGAGFSSAQERPPFLFPDGIVFDIAFSKDGQTMAIACEDKAVRIYDWKSGKLRHTLSGHDQRVWATAFAPDGKTLAACTGEYRQPDHACESQIWYLAT